MSGRTKKPSLLVTVSIPVCAVPDMSLGWANVWEIAEMEILVPPVILPTPTFTLALPVARRAHDIITNVDGADYAPSS